jgi:EAL domain-containing protein (putative c-di-GMP-specific phosphodiesterase class I)
MLAKLTQIQRMGVKIAIDDFGMSHSSLQHLSRLPVDTLKLDRSFIAKMTQTPDDMELVASMIALAHRLRLNVVAKGVETEEQRNLLRLLRCDQIQGYLVVAPSAKQEIEEILRRDQSNATGEWQRLIASYPASDSFDSLDSRQLGSG